MVGIVPISYDTTEYIYFPVDIDGVKVLEVVDEMVGVLLADIFDAKIIYYEAEIYWPSFMVP